METQNEVLQAKASKLFNPINVGPFKISHRVVLPPLTRMRTISDDVPNELMVEHYAQRTTPGGLLIAEGTSITANANGYFRAPGIFTDAQEAGWKKVTDAVHAKGGVIFLQLYHAGRISHVDLQPGGTLPLGPSVIPHENVAATPNGWEPVTLNRALETDEVGNLAKAFGKATARAKTAGFDGVELHGANGYLVDQFLQDGSNQRTDSYGGSIENRTRFMLEIIQEMIENWSADHVGVRLSPSGTFNQVSDSDALALFNYAVAELNKFGLAYLHIIEPRMKGGYLDEDAKEPVAAKQLRTVFDGPIIVAGGFDKESAEAVLESGDADLVAFGRHFIANPDLPYRYKNNISLNHYDRDTFYGGDGHGYTDYPAIKD